MKGLMLHCGAHSRTLDEVRAIPTPLPTLGVGTEKKKGSLHVPIPHSDLYDMVRGEIGKQTQYNVVSENFGVTDDGARFFGLMEIKNGHNADDHGLVVGLRNSHDKSFAGGLVVGSHVFVCDNLAFSGEIKVLRKHTNNIMRDLPGLITNAVAKIGSSVDFQNLRFDAYKNTPIDTPQADHILMDAWREGVLSSRTVAKAREEWDKPSHDEFQDRNVWSLFNDCTEAFKGSGGRIFNGIDKETLRLHSFMDNICKLESYEDFCKRVNAEFAEVEDAEFVMAN